LNRNKDETQRTEPCRATKEQNIGERGNIALKIAGRMKPGKEHRRDKGLELE